ncbi:hypothetical protein AGMMS49975_07800 [Clostridia bacterium]|nr:hypothetical protein AGMMS49975_07800 [Clostridia bacterium]
MTSMLECVETLFISDSELNQTAVEGLELFPTASPRDDLLSEDTTLNFGYRFCSTTLRTASSYTRQNGTAVSEIEKTK